MKQYKKSQHMPQTIQRMKFFAICKNEIILWGQGSTNQSASLLSGHLKDATKAAGDDLHIMAEL